MLSSVTNYSAVPVLPLSHGHDSVEFFHDTQRAADNCVFGLLDQQQCLKFRVNYNIKFGKDII